MRLISLLIGLVIIALLIGRQLTSDAPSSEAQDHIDNQNVTLPKIPVAPENVKEFEADLNEFIQDTASKKNKELEDALGK